MENLNQYSQWPDKNPNFESNLNSEVTKKTKSAIYSSLSKYFNIIDKLHFKSSTIEKINQFFLEYDYLKDKIKEIVETEHNVLSSSHNKKLTKLLNKKEKVKQDIFTYQKFLPSCQEEEPSTLFEIEHEMREALNNEFPEKTKIQEIYKNYIIPLVIKTKEEIIINSMHPSSQAAAAKGKALQAGLNAIVNLTENQPVIQESKVSAQKVYLLPQENAVFKHSSAAAEEEESIINDLFDLMSEQAVVSSFNLKSASRKKFGIEIPEEVKRGYSLNSKSNIDILINAVGSKLSDNDYLILKKYQKYYAQLKSDLLNHQKIEKMIWMMKMPDGNWKMFNFKEVRELYSAKLISSETLVGPSQMQAIPISQHIKEEDDLFWALIFIPITIKEDEIPFLLPDLKNKYDKKAYEKCEKFTWSFEDDKGTCICTFKELHAFYLCKFGIKNIKIYKNDNPNLLVSQNDLNDALNVKWKVFCPELMKIESGKITPLGDVQAKPFIKGMILMTDLEPDFRERILERLSKKSEFNAILTGEVQLLDLHSGNLGVVPNSNEDYERFKELEFSIIDNNNYIAKNMSFNSLALLSYNLGVLPKQISIEFVENEKFIIKKMQDFSELQRALDTEWELVLFDTDVSLTESNVLQYQVRAKQIEHFIPLRSVLFETEWKNNPLSQETIHRLMNSHDRDRQVRYWIDRADSPIYKRLSADAKQSLMPFLDFFIGQYNLSEPRFNHDKVTIKILHQRFIEKVSSVNDSTAEFWAIIEEDLSHVVVQEKDSWESIAKKFHQDVGVLKLLNPNGLEIGKKISIQYDLTSDTPEILKIRKRIAAQFFPRITDPQRIALEERFESRKKYLMSYQALSNSKLEGEQLFEQIEKFVKLPQSPLTSLQKNEILSDLLKNKIKYLNSSEEIIKLKENLCFECQPTYFNLMKAMYPLLADAYALNKILYGTDFLAGKYIGNYLVPLEEIIKKAKNEISPKSPERQLVENLENAIKNTKKPAFMGYNA